MDNANIQAILNVYMYVAEYAKPSKNQTFGDIVSNLQQYSDGIKAGTIAAPEGWGSVQQRQIELLVAAVNNNKGLGDYVLKEQFNVGWGAAAFVSPEGTVSVVFQGTASGEWIDNAIPFTGIPQTNEYYIYDSNGNIVDTIVLGNDHASPQQAAALNWFNEVCAKNGWNSDTNIIISGHSKGGNKAQFITINSPFVDECYNFDGQGFSHEAIAMFQDKFGDEYERRLQKMHTYALYNDYVNILGVAVVPAANIHYLDAAPFVEDDNPGAFHYMDGMLKPDGTFNKPHLGGELGHQGEFGELLKNVNNVIMNLPPNMREPMVYGVMNVLQSMNGPAINGETVSTGTTIIGTAGAVSILVAHLIKTKDGREALYELAKLYADDAVEGIVSFYNGIGEKYGVVAEVAAIVATIGIACVFAPIIMSVLGFIIDVAAFAGTLLTLCSWLAQLGKEIYVRMKAFCETVVNIFSSWFNKWFAGGNNYSALDQSVNIDTALLKSLAGRLASVNKRVVEIDRSMDRLYWKVGLRDLWNLLQADLLTGYSWRLTRCKDYLNDTANEFESAEYVNSMNAGG